MAGDDCCPKGSWNAPLNVPSSVKSSNGNLVTIGAAQDLEIYVAKPSSLACLDANDASERKAVLVFTDVFGLQNRLFAICDKLSTDLGIYVIAIDCLRGETKDKHMDDIMGWLRGHPFDTTEKADGKHEHSVRADIECTLNYLATNFNIQPSNVGGIGFCWGVWALTKACAEGIQFQCGVGFHPSLKFEDAAFEMDQVEMAKFAAKNTPLLYLVAGNDADNIKPPDGEIANIISSSIHEGGKTGKQQPKCVVFPEMAHGWVSRGDTNVDKVKEDAEAALLMASEFLREWM